MARTPMKRRAADGLGAPQSHRSVVGILQAIATLEDSEQVAALRKAPRAVKEICRWAYGNHDIDLPTTPLTYVRIPPSAYSEAPDDYFDLMSGEAMRLTRLYVLGVHPTLTTENRVSLWKETMARLPRDEVEFMDHLRMQRSIPGISRETVTEAWHGLLDQAPAPDAPVPGITYPPTAFEPRGDEAPTIHERVTPAAPREPMTDGEMHYQDLMTRLGFGRM